MLARVYQSIGDFSDVELAQYRRRFYELRFRANENDNGGIVIHGGTLMQLFAQISDQSKK
jgi:hypothetical protein